MLLVLDVGNTNVKVGLYEGETFIKSWRISTLASRTADEFGMVLFDLFSTRDTAFEDIDGIIVSSVAPSLNYTIEHACTYYMNRKPIFVDSDSKTGMTFLYTNPSELGADRIVSAVAAYTLYKGPCIVVDFGSATTFNAITIDGKFLGGAIAPGIKNATESLVNTAARLPRIELVAPKSVLGKTTIENMQVGIAYGFTGLVSYIINKIKEEDGMANAKVIATGGLSELVMETDASIIDIVDRALALKGLKLMYDLNK
ncbi:MAG: type III pantothenate kinase [Clostridia bacterium]